MGKFSFQLKPVNFKRDPTIKIWKCDEPKILILIPKILIQHQYSKGLDAYGIGYFIKMLLEKHISKFEKTAIYLNTIMDIVNPFFIY